VTAPRRALDATLEARFWSKVDRSPGHGPHGDCWAWTAFRDRQGYGRIKLGGKRGLSALAHRVSLQLSGVEVPSNLDVLHSCDNTSCVNPTHLRVGTHAENMRDASARGRAAIGVRNGRHTKPERTVIPRGEQHGCARLTWEIVREIRASGETNAALARRLGVGPTAISKVRLGQTWREATNA
jgi:hypothetical protein